MRRTLVALAVVVLAVACGSAGEKADVETAARIVPLQGGIAEIVFGLGLGESVVGRDVSATFPEAAALPLVTRGHDLSVEGLLALRPTIVLGDARSGPKEALEAIRSAGVPVVLVPEAFSLEAINPRIRAVATALGAASEGEKLIGRLDKEIHDATSSARDTHPRVAFLYVRGGAGTYLLGGRGSGADSLLRAVGAIDVGADAGLGPFTPLTAEALVKAAPDVVLVMQEGLNSVGGIDGLLRLAGVAQSPAGIHRRVLVVEDGLLLSFGPRVAEVLRTLRDGLDGASS